MIQHLLRKQESGSVLIAGLLTLVLLTGIGIAAVTSSVSESDISGNELRQKEAFFAAEIALQYAESVVAGLAQMQDVTNSQIAGYYAKNKQPAWEEMKWDDTDSVRVPTLPSGYPTFAGPLRYTVAERNFDRDSFGIGMKVPTGVNLFNVGGRGFGGSQSSRAVVRSIYARRLS